jgi:cytochrome c553
MHEDTRRTTAAKGGRHWAAVVLALASLGGGPSGRASEESVDRATQSALALDARPARGAAQFRANCTRCHGPQGHGNAAGGVPAIAAQRFTYLVRQLANFAGSEREGPAMHRVVAQNGMRNPQSWVDVAAYLSRRPPAAALEVGSGTHVALGRGIFREQCGGRHLADARGDANGYVPSLSNQNYCYLLGQFQKIKEGSRHNMDENLARFMRSFSEDEMQATADYLSRLEGSGASHQIMRDDGVVVH